MATTKKVTVDAAEKKMAVKAEAPAVDEKVPEAIAEGKAEEKEESSAAEAKKAKKTSVKKETAPKKEVVVKSAMYVQFDGKEVSEKTLLSAVKKAYIKLGNKASDIKKVEIYVKPEEHAAYYVINGVGSEEYKIEL